MMIRPESPTDIAAIRTLTTAAFRDAPHSSGTEAQIVDALRDAGALTVSLVAQDEDEIVGHVAFSPVIIDGVQGGWFGLGPVSVAPDRQRAGIGQALIRAGLAQLEASGAQGCVVLGDPLYYGRFGFRNDPALSYGGAPAVYFQRLEFRDASVAGKVTYHSGFDAQ